ncbi:hypothetical protein [Methylobacter luteus]|jgi:hypothetical protein|uniref:hypothetical protein n=1 Tax=Methylobacter luteus TaxID=415 RepID=UPI00042604A6|nr:hypothetical protein [Methylobacter luteus]
MTNSFFAKKVDRRSRSAMVDFLRTHYRYDTLNSWNRSTSYAQCIKIHRLGLTSEQSDKAYDLLETDFWDEIRWPIDEFTDSQGGCYTIGTNGRSGGYLVLHEPRRELTGHLSYCPSCGQRNFKKVPPAFEEAAEQVIAQEILKSRNAWQSGVYLSQPSIEALLLSHDEKLSIITRLKAQLADCSLTDACGACWKPRRNYSVPPVVQLAVYAGKGIDQGEAFDAEEWSMEALRERVDLVCAFDAVCDQIRHNFIALLVGYDVVEETVHRPVKVKVLRERAAGGFDAE